MSQAEKEKKCVEKYQELKNLKLVGNALGIPWQTVYVYLKKAGIPVIGDKARYGSVTDRLAVCAEQSFKKSVPKAIDNNELKYQATVDFYIDGITIDVKAAVLKNAGRIDATGKSFSARWGYCISKQKDIADFFVLYAYGADKELKHVFLMPRDITNNKSGISIPETLNSKWADYKIEPHELAQFFDELTSKKVA